ncbi:MAG: hypothetical protein AMXMBFR84_22000 [Candidatus Hydrogenedentota bacterium]
MSSILDALRKLEQEQGEGGRNDIGTVEPDRADRNPPEYRAAAGAVTISIEPSMILVGSVTAVLLLASVTAAALFMLMRNPSAPGPSVAAVSTNSSSNAAEVAMNVSANAIAPTPVREPAVEPSVAATATLLTIDENASAVETNAAEVPVVEVEAPVRVASKADLEVSPKPIENKPEPVVRAKPAEPQSEQVATVQPQPAAVVPKPVEDEPVQLPAPPSVQPAIVSETDVQAQSTPDAAPDSVVDLNSLPILSESDRLRLNLPEITINIVGTASSRNPRPSAMINYKRVMVGEFVPGTNAKLVAVDVKGIGISVGGIQFFVPKR